MSILVDRNTRVLVQGITGAAGSFHTEQMLAYGTNVVAGVTPNRGGTRFQGTVPIFHTIQAAVRETGADAAGIFVPPPFAADAIIEAAEADIPLIVAITEGIPILDMVRVRRFVESRPRCRLIGPNCPGVITPKECKIGIMPGYIHRRGPVGVISRSGTLTYEAVWQLTQQGLGQSTCIGLGGDPIVGTSFIELLRGFADDPQTELGRAAQDGGEHQGGRRHRSTFSCHRAVLVRLEHTVQGLEDRHRDAGRPRRGASGPLRRKHGVPSLPHRDIPELLQEPALPERGLGQGKAPD